MRYDKLVRDKIPEIIRNSGKIPTTHIAKDNEYLDKLKKKLSEEVDEFLKESNEEELADILEVIDAICKNKKFEKDEIENIKSKKRKERGGFDEKIILDEVKD